jgi:hypothetical protein
MHCEKVSSWATPDPLGDRPDRLDDPPPPHAAASRANPVAVIAAATVRIAASVAAVPVLALKTAGSSASAQDRAAILRL